MLEIYSNNKTVAQNEALPLSNVTLRKGVTATVDNDTITLQRCGVYCVSVDTSVQVPVGGAVSFQLRKDEVLQPQAVSSLSVNGTPADGAYNLMNGSFQTLVQVPRNNSPSPCSEPTTVQIVNTGAEAVYEHFHVTVTKLV